MLTSMPECKSRTTASILAITIFRQQIDFPITTLNLDSILGNDCIFLFAKVNTVLFGFFVLEFNKLTATTIEGQWLAELEQCLCTCLHIPNHFGLVITDIVNMVGDIVFAPICDFLQIFHVLLLLRHSNITLYIQTY
jgi:hypothetical protein